MEVLLVEDETLVRESLADGLAAAGLVVIQAPNAETALGAAADRGHQTLLVLVTDVDLGVGMNGLALAAEMRRRWPDIGIVIMTGNLESVSGRHSASREVCLLKPFGLLGLTATVHKLMDRSCC